MLYLALVVGPALLTAAMAHRWLREEDARLRAQARASLEAEASVHAASIHLVAREAVDAILREVAQADQTMLQAWRARHPLVRHVFIWEPPDQLILPDARWANADEQAFIRRYEALFSGRERWRAPSSEESYESFAARPAEQARKAVRRVMASPMRDASSVETGWLTWFWERDLHVLVWVRDVRDDVVRGAELDMPALYARFLPLLDAALSDGHAWALYDHHDAVIAQTAAMSDHEKVMSVRVPVGVLLPHWHVEMISSAPPGALGSVRFFGQTMLLILVVAILAGGALLMVQGYRSYLDAQRKTTFVSNVSHELKTPLTTIRMYAEMLEDGRVPDALKQRRYLGVIAKESQRLTRLVNNVLDFGRLEQRRRTYRMEDVDIRAMVRDVVQAQSARFDEAGMTLTFHDAEQKPAWAFVDRDAVEQVVLNLLDNAAKYAIEGRRVDIDVSQDVSGVHVVVADRGAGVPRAHAARIFNSFHRVDDSLTARHPGAGLGLSIGRRLLRDMGGDLLYREREGGGAEFVMVLARGKNHGQS